MTDENKRFCGRPNYTGPTVGKFYGLHHDVLFEHSHDVMERVRYVRREKPKNEVATRLHNMMYLDPDECPAVLACIALDADYEAKRDSLYADYEAKRDSLYADYKAKRAPLDADYEAKRAPLDAEILEYVKRHIPDCAWNGKELVFP